MKLFNLLVGRNAKRGLSTAQAVGLATVVGVAGVAGWQLLSSGNDVNPNTAFSSHDEEEVVYVAAGPGGEYESASYGAGGETRSGIRVKKSRDMQLMELDAQRNPYAAADEIDRQEQDIKAFKLDGSNEGLGMGKNSAKDLGGAMGGDLGALNAQLAQIQAAAKAKSQEAAQGAANAAQAAAKQRAGTKYGPAADMARAGGHNLNSTPLQASVNPGDKRGGSLGGSEQQGTHRLPPATREAKFTGDREAIVEQGRRYRQGTNELETWHKVTADVAANAARSDNALVAAAFGAGQQHGLMRIKGENITLTGGSSTDFDEEPNISGLRRGLNNAGALVAQLQQAQENLKLSLDAWVGEMTKQFQTKKVLQATSLWGSVAAGAGIGALIGGPVGAFLGGVFGLGTGIFLRHKMNTKWNLDLRDKAMDNSGIRDQIDAFRKTWGSQGSRFADEATSIVDELSKDDYWKGGDEFSGWGTMKRNYDRMVEEYWPQYKEAEEK